MGNEQVKGYVEVHLASIGNNLSKVNIHVSPEVLISDHRMLRKESSPFINWDCACEIATTI
jgi:hypothetical protein